MQQNGSFCVASVALLLACSAFFTHAMPVPPERVDEVLEMFEGGFLPFEQVSVSLGDEAGSYSFCWVSSIPNTPSVYYMGQQFIGKTFTYQRTGMHGHYTSGNIHKVPHQPLLRICTPSRALMFRFKSVAFPIAATYHTALP